ncbi:MAG: hypothetical protein LC122_13220 [Chitinophagales bacterium]|nr:hypothetical protein [Chitinophagales bacterium]
MSFDFKIKNGDLVISNGELETVVDSEKLIQDILKICITPVGSDPLNPWYGSYLSKTVIGSSEDAKFLMTVSKEQLRKALENLKQLQLLQIRQYQQISADEQIADIRSISVRQNELNPTVFEIEIIVITRGLKPITNRFRLSTI